MLALLIFAPSAGGRLSAIKRYRPKSSFSLLLEEGMENQTSSQAVTQEEVAREPLEGVTRPGFDQLFRETTDIWKANLADLVLVTLVFLPVFWIPAFGAGYVRALLKAVRGEKPELKDIFSAWDCFGAALVYGLTVIVGVFLLAMIPIFGWFVPWLFFMLTAPGFFAIADRNLDPLSAIKWSASAFKSDVGNWVAVLLVGGLIAFSGAIAFVLGIFFTLPLGYLMIALQFDKQEDLVLEED
jgi:hypothetical protein